MTKPQLDGKSVTAFSAWLRNCKELDSRLGYTNTNLDYMWSMYKNDKCWMLIEEKRFRKGWLDFAQDKAFQHLDSICGSDPTYRGFHLVVFEFDTPDSGWVNIDCKRVTTAQLIEFLQFKASPEMYVSYFIKKVN